LFFFIILVLASDFPGLLNSFVREFFPEHFKANFLVPHLSVFFSRSRQATFSLFLSFSTSVRLWQPVAAFFCLHQSSIRADVYAL
jgi:hypothetical protein